MQEDNIEELYEHILENRNPLKRPYNRGIIDETQDEVGDVVLSYEVLEDVPFRVTRIGKDLSSEPVKDGWYNTLLLMDRTVSDGNKVYAPEDFKQDLMASTELFENNSFDLDELTATKAANYIEHYSEELEIEENNIENGAVSKRMKNLVESVPGDATLVTLYSAAKNLDVSEQINTPLGALKASIGTGRDIRDVGETFNDRYEVEQDRKFAV